MPKLQYVLTVISNVFITNTFLAKLRSQEVIDFIYPSHFSTVATLVPFLVLAGSVSVLTLVAIASAIVENTARFRTQIYTGALLSNIITAILLIPRIGLKGAAIGTLVSEVFILLAWIFIGKYLLKNLNLNWSRSLILIAIAFLFVTYYEPGFMGNNVVEKIILSLAMLLGMAVFIRQSSVYNLIFSKKPLKSV
jgi:O-antigen/teichoic acid export membrane protein